MTQPLSMEPLSKGLKVAIYIITLIFLYFVGVTFFHEYVNEDTAKTITTYLQTILIVIISYYWGNSSKRNDDKNPIDIVIPDKSICTDIKQIETVNKVTNIDKIKQ